MSENIDVAIIGAGPNGLSIAAHLAARGISFRIFGKPMESWLTQMPRDMLLKSEGFASSLYDPRGQLSLARYCRTQGLPYADIGLPVPLRTFSQYGLAFQRQAVPSLEQKMLSTLRKSAGGFTLELDDGEMLEARRVVVAVGISHFSHVPPALAKLPRELVSHSSAHVEVDQFKNRKVIVLGGGSSAIDMAALLHEAGANVRLVARTPALEIPSKVPLPRPLSDRLRAPLSGLGPSWHAWFFSYMPFAFHRFPEARRLKWVKNHFGPAGGWFMADRIYGGVCLMLGQTPIGVQARGSMVALELATKDGTAECLEADHIIAATGYRPSMKRLAFIEPGLATAIDTVQETPILTPRFQSSIPGLYFVGPIAANSFGPLMRFAYGAKFTARLLARHLAARGAARARGPHADAALAFE